MEMFKKLEGMPFWQFSIPSSNLKLKHMFRYFLCIKLLTCYEILPRVLLSLHIKNKTLN